jgi:hypothetical protein
MPRSLGCLSTSEAERAVNGDHRGTVYGLPFEYDRPVNSWEELRHYLERIAESGVAVRVNVGPSATDPYFEARGKLQRSGRESDAAHALFAINTDSSREDGGLISLWQDNFRGGELLTYDGDDYFHLTVRMEGVVLRIEDTNSM